MDPEPSITQEALLRVDETAPLDIAKVRSSFPAIGDDQASQVFFDNAGGSQTLGTVIDSICDYLTNTNVQLGATYTISKKSTELYTAGYAAAAKFINAGPDEIVLGPSTTTLLRILSLTLPFQPGDELVISGIDHEANIAPWVDLAARLHLHLKWWLPPPPTATAHPVLTPATLTPLLSARTRLVAFTHASNLLGTIHDVAGLAAAVRAAAPAALVCVDGVAYAPHRQVDVRALGVDVYAFSWYKVYGPHMAQVYASPRARGMMRSLGHFFNAHETLENKMALGGSAYELVACIPAVVGYMEGKYGGIVRQEAELQGVLLRYLVKRGDATVYGDTGGDPLVRVPTISFTVKGWSSKDVVDAVERVSNFGSRWGFAYSNRLGEFLGLDKDGPGVVRVSLVHYNTVGEVEGFIAILDKVLSSPPAATLT